MQRRTVNALARGFAVGVACGALSLAGPRVARALESPDQESAEQEATHATAYEHTDVEDPYDPTRAMHPVRVAAYVLHPVGVLLDYTIVRPAVWVVRQEPFRTIFGYGDD
jgi:hypothetical protein